MGLGTSLYLALAADVAALAAAAAAAAPDALPAATAKPGAMAHAAASILVGEVVSDSLDSPDELGHGRVVTPEELDPIS